MLLMTYSDRWRHIRKIFHAILNKQNMATFAPFQDLESKHLLYDYLQRPEQWFLANQRFSNSVIMGVIFGKRMELGDPNIKALFDSSNEFIGALQPGANMVDGFYFLDWVPKPLQWWRPRGQRYYEKTIQCVQTFPAFAVSNESSTGYIEMKPTTSKRRWRQERHGTASPSSSSAHRSP